MPLSVAAEVAYLPCVMAAATTAGFFDAAVSNFTSGCCTFRLADGNAPGQTHSETSSNYLCTNDIGERRAASRGVLHTREKPLPTALRPTSVDDERQALTAEGLDPDNPAVVAAIDMVRWELSRYLSSM